MAENPEQTSYLPYLSFVDNLASWSEDPSKNFVHAVLGIVTEIHEYLNATDPINGLEELGDAEYYITFLLLQAMRLDPDKVQAFLAPLGNDAEEYEDALFEAAEQIGFETVVRGECNELLDISKRWIAYDKAPDMHDVLRRCRAVIDLANLHGPYPEPSLQVRQDSNRRKLLKRYPSGTFNVTNALFRNTEAERGALAAS